MEWCWILTTSTAGDNVEEDDDNQPKDSQLSSFVNYIINRKKSENGLIQSLKTTSMT